VELKRWARLQTIAILLYALLLIAQLHERVLDAEAAARELDARNFHFARILTRVMAKRT
jgi:hypothetical protein